MKPILLGAATLLILLTGCATRQDFMVLEHRLLLLEQQNAQLAEANQKLNRQLEDRLTRFHQNREASEKSLLEHSADLTVELDSMRMELARLNGQVEEVRELQGRRIEALEEAILQKETELRRLEALGEANAGRVAKLEQYLEVGNPDGQAPGTGAAPSASRTRPVEEMTPQELYAAAKDAFDKGDYERSRELFQAFLKENPQSPEADNAQFWIGEIHYRQDWYEKAIVEYQQVIEKYPKGNKVPAALLKQGYAFEKMGDDKNATLIWQDLIKKHPQSSEAGIARKKLS